MPLADRPCIFSIQQWGVPKEDNPKIPQVDSSSNVPFQGVNVGDWVRPSVRKWKPLVLCMIEGRPRRI